MPAAAYRTSHSLALSRTSRRSHRTFYSHVAAYDGHDSHGRFASRPVLPRYIGSARGYCIGAIRVIAGQYPRVVHTWRYLGAPGATIDANTMRFGILTHDELSVYLLPK